MLNRLKWGLKEFPDPIWKKWFWLTTFKNIYWLFFAMCLVICTVIWDQLRNQGYQVSFRWLSLSLGKGREGVHRKRLTREEGTRGSNDLGENALWEHWSRDRVGELEVGEGHPLGALYHLDWECFIGRASPQGSYKGSAKLANWHCLRNSWQALECLFGFLWCLWCPRVKIKSNVKHVLKIQFLGKLSKWYKSEIRPMEKN